MENYTEKGVHEYGLNNMKQALEYFAKVEESDPMYSKALAYSARIVIIKGNEEKAFRLAQKSLERNFDNALAYYCLGHIAQKQKEKEKAETLFRKTIDLATQTINQHTTDYEAYTIRGDAYQALEKYTKAIEDYTKSVEINPHFYKAAYNKGAAYLKQKDFLQAIKEFTQLITENPGKADYYARRGNAYYFIKDYAKSIADHSKALIFDPNNAYHYACRGDVYYQDGNYAKSIADYNKALTIDPNNAGYYAWRGNAYCKAGNYAKSIADYSTALTIDSNNADYYIWRGNVYSLIKNYAKSIADYSKALTINPNNADYYTWRGNAYSLIKNYAKSIADYSKALTINPNNADYYTWRGNAYCKAGNYAKSIADYDKALTIDSNNAYYYVCKGDAYYQNGNYAKSIADYSTALTIDSNNAYYYGWRGLAYYQDGNYAKSIADYDKALAIDLNIVYYYGWRGLAYYQDGNYAKSIADYDKALTINPSDANYYAWRGDACSQNGYYEDAVKDYISSALLNPSEKYVYWKLNEAFQYVENKETIVEFILEKIQAEPNREKVKLVVPQFCYPLFTHTNRTSFKKFGEGIKFLKVEILSHLIHSCVVRYENMGNILNTLTDPIYMENGNHILDESYFSESVEEINTEEDKATLRGLWWWQYVLLSLINLKKGSRVKEFSYYTTVEVLENLIGMRNSHTDKETVNSSGVPMRMMSISRANDPKEGAVVFEMLRDNGIPMQDKPPIDRYATVQTSFSRVKDSLTMFRLYGKKDHEEGTGVCLVFGTDFFDTEHANTPYETREETPEGIFHTRAMDLSENEIEPKAKKENISDPSSLYQVFYYHKEYNKLIYNPCEFDFMNCSIDLGKKGSKNYKQWKSMKEDKKIKTVQHNIGYTWNKLFEILRKCQKDEAMWNAASHLLINIRYLIKHAAFMEEQEYRILDLVPYNAGELKNDNGRVYKEYLRALHKNALQEIIIGPKVKNANALAETIRWHLTKVGYPHIKVKISEAPLT